MSFYRHCQATQVHIIWVRIGEDRRGYGWDLDGMAQEGMMVRNGNGRITAAELSQMPASPSLIPLWELGMMG